MTPSNRVDEMSDHLQWLALAMIEALPDTIKRLKIRADNAMFEGQNRLRNYRAVHQRMSEFLTDEYLAGRYNDIVAAAIIPQHAWDVQYVRYLLEVNYCTHHIMEGVLPIGEMDIMIKRRLRVMKTVTSIESEHRIPVRYDLAVAMWQGLKEEAIKMWIDVLVDELRAATADQLYSYSAIYDHGHGKMVQDKYRKIAKLQFSWSAGGSCREQTYHRGTKDH